MKKIIINPVLNPKELNKVYLEKGRLQVHNFFTEDTANYLQSLLLNNKTWNLAYNSGNNYYESPISELEKLTPEQKRNFMNKIFEKAANGFQYVFMQYYISQAIKLNEEPGHPLHQIETFVNSDYYLDFMRELTADSSISKADSYASIYDKEHFLTEHDDKHDTHDRVAACIFNFTQHWNRNWGGQLAFFDDKGNIEQAFIPTFNTLNILSVPQSHAVQQVTAFAKEKRYSLLSWLHR
jgi:Rps23 Pro-64 3,4-dihydroxylase Tpa1-like proline 4-hydroxylase